MCSRTTCAALMMLVSFLIMAIAYMPDYGLSDDECLASPECSMVYRFNTRVHVD